MPRGTGTLAAWRIGNTAALLGDSCHTQLPAADTDVAWAPVGMSRCSCTCRCAPARAPEAGARTLGWPSGRDSHRRPCSTGSQHKRPAVERLPQPPACMRRTEVVISGRDLSGSLREEGRESVDRDREGARRAGGSRPRKRTSCRSPPLPCCTILARARLHSDGGVNPKRTSDDVVGKWALGRAVGQRISPGCMPHSAHSRFAHLAAVSSRLF